MRVCVDQREDKDVVIFKVERLSPTSGHWMTEFLDRANKPVSDIVLQEWANALDIMLRVGIEKNYGIQLTLPEEVNTQSGA
jgi:hypothetical protein